MKEKEKSFLTAGMIVFLLSLLFVPEMISKKRAASHSGCVAYSGTINRFELYESSIKEYGLFNNLKKEITFNSDTEFNLYIGQSRTLTGFANYHVCLSVKADNRRYRFIEFINEEEVYNYFSRKRGTFKTSINKNNSEKLFNRRFEKLPKTIQNAYIKFFGKEEVTEPEVTITTGFTLDDRPLNSLYELSIKYPKIGIYAEWREPFVNNHLCKFEIYDGDENLICSEEKETINKEDRSYICFSNWISFLKHRSGRWQIKIYSDENLISEKTIDVKPFSDIYPFDDDLIVAVEKNDYNKVRYLIESGRNVNSVDYYQTSLLRIAATKGYTRIAEYLIEKGASLDPVDNSGMTELMLYSAIGDISKVEKLIHDGSKVNYGDIYKETPLYYAVMGNQYATTQILISNGAEIDYCNGQITALCEACNNGNIDITKLLLDNGADINKPHSQGMTPLMRAIGSGNTELVKFLIKNGADVNKKSDNYTPLVFAERFAKDAQMREIIYSAGGR